MSIKKCRQTKLFYPGSDKSKYNKVKTFSRYDSTGSTDGKYHERYSSEPL